MILLLFILLFFVHSVSGSLPSRYGNGAFVLSPSLVTARASREVDLVVLHEQQQEAAGGSPLLDLRVTATSSHVLLPGFLTGHGRLLRSSDNKPLQGMAPNQDVAVHLVAGTSSSSSGQEGEGELLAFVDPGSARLGARIRVPSNCVFQKPRMLSGEQACALPYYALDLLPPLMKDILPPTYSSSDGPTSGKKTAVVTGAGPQAAFAIQVRRTTLVVLTYGLVTWALFLAAYRCCDPGGFRVIGCSRRSFDELKKWGCEDVVDFSRDSFVEKHPSLAVVVDTVGFDADGLASNLKRLTGAAYVSVMPSSTRRMQAQGLLQGASLFSSMFMGKQQTPTTTAYWLPEKQGREVVQYALNAAEAGALTVPAKLPSLDDYMDAILWPKDADSEYRFGFPASLEGGSTGGLSDEQLFKRYTQASMRSEGELHGVMSKFKSAFQRMSAGEGVVENDWQMPTVLFVTAPNCRVCLLTKPKVSQLAEEFQSVQFLHMVADPSNYRLAEALEVETYPYFIIYSSGERVSTHKALGPELVKQIYEVAKLGRRSSSR